MDTNVNQMVPVFDVYVKISSCVSRVNKTPQRFFFLSQKYRVSDRISNSMQEVVVSFLNQVTQEVAWVTRWGSVPARGSSPCPKMEMGSWWE